MGTHLRQETIEDHVRAELVRDDRAILLMAHLIVGFPSLEANWRMLEIMQEVEVDLVELQMPFSEPVADGPTFVRANQLALEAGLSVDEYFDFMTRATASFSIPHLMMGYYNTAYKLGHQVFCERLRAAAAAGFILPDLPIEEYGDLFDLSRDNGLSPILMMTPTNREHRLAAIGELASGFVYAVARKGVTGKRTELEQGLYRFVDRCRSATRLPLAVGFGLRQREDVELLHGRVEIAIVGSVLLDAWESGGEDGYRALLKELAGGRAPA